MEDDSDCCTSLKECSRKNHRLIVLLVITATVLFLAVSLTVVTRRREARMSLRLKDSSPHPDYYTIPNFLSASDFAQVERSLQNVKYVRRSTPMRNGEAISSMNMPKPIIDVIRRGRVLDRIQSETGVQLSFTPKTDENSISALRYSRPGDGIDAHYDGNVYIGKRWVGLLIVRDDGDSRLVVRDKTLDTLPPNTLVLFEGDKVRHAVTRRVGHGDRVLLNILFCDVCSLRSDMASKIWSSIVSNFAFY